MLRQWRKLHLILGCVARLRASSITSARNMQTSISKKSAFDGRNALSPVKPFGDLAKAEKKRASYGRGSRLHFSCLRFSAPQSASKCVVPVTAASQSNQQWLSLVDKGRVSGKAYLVPTPNTPSLTANTAPNHVVSSAAFYPSPEGRPHRRHTLFSSFEHVRNITLFRRDKH
jgi:hypothetical protein